MVTAMEEAAAAAARGKPAPPCHHHPCDQPPAPLMRAGTPGAMMMGLLARIQQPVPRLSFKLHARASRPPARDGQQRVSRITETSILMYDLGTDDDDWDNW